MRLEDPTLGVGSIIHMLGSPISIDYLLLVNWGAVVSGLKFLLSRLPHRDGFYSVFMSLPSFGVFARYFVTAAREVTNTTPTFTRWTPAGQRGVESPGTVGDPWAIGALSLEGIR